MGNDDLNVPNIDCDRSNLAPQWQCNLSRVRVCIFCGLVFFWLPY